MPITASEEEALHARIKVVTDRLGERIRHYDSQARTCRNLFIWLKFSQIVLASSIPAIALFHKEHSVSDLSGAVVTMGIIGAIAVILEGVLHTFQVQRYWIKFRAAEVTLTSERSLYDSHTGRYETLSLADALNILSGFLEEFLRSQNKEWVDITQATLAEQKK